MVLNPSSFNREILMILSKRSLFILSSLAIALIYLASQYLQGVNHSKDARISSLLEEIQWKNQVISEMKDQLAIKQQRTRTEPINQPARASYDTPKKQANFKGERSTPQSQQPVEEPINESTQTDIQIVQLTEALERKNNTLGNIGQLAPFSKINLTEENRDAYFDRMAEITNGSAYNTEYLMDTDKYGKVAFSVSDTTMSADDGIEDTNIFSSENKRLYAHFDLPNYPHDQVLVKWYRDGDNKLTHMDYFKINNVGSENFTWIEQDSTWEKGNYIVEVFSASEASELLSAGNYIVDN
jgi:hypothetical protein